MNATENTQAKHEKNGAPDKPVAKRATSGPRDPKSETRCFRPALFGAYRDLTKLRYDYPLVLGGIGNEAVVCSLSAIFDEILRETAPRGADGEGLRCHALRLEEAIRKLVAGGARPWLSKAWDIAENDVLDGSGESERETVAADLKRLKSELTFDGALIDCAANAGPAVVLHLWRAAELRKARDFFTRIDRLIYRLENMLRADAMSSPEAWEAGNLKHSMGGAFAGEFDFEALGGAIRSVAAKNGLPEKRRQRVERALAILKSQKLYQRGDTAFEHRVFDNCADAVEVYEECLEEIATLMKAIGTAELELANRYREDVHDPAFDAFGPASLQREQIARFPSPLVLSRNGAEPFDLAAIIEPLASRVPLKVAVVSHNILGDAEIRADLGTIALGLNDVFIVQTAASHLRQNADALARGVGTDGPALFNIFSGAGSRAALLSPYLVAAAASESRMYPSFAYDPSRGETWAGRFEISHNPCPPVRWVTHRLDYEDDEQQRRFETIAFTPIDLAACDPEWDDRFEDVPAGEWTDAQIPAAEYLDLPETDRAGRKPYVLAIDERNRLWRREPDDALLSLAARRAWKWRSLQELGGIDNSHAKQLLERERLKWNEEKEAEFRELRSKTAAPPAPTAPPGPETKATGPAEPASGSEAPPDAGTNAAPPDEPYIETPRCTSCDECIKINNRMFVYNENKQAAIADPDAGPYADLVAAAENCQVSIIHPGKPRKPDEPNLDELRKRAEPFL